MATPPPGAAYPTPGLADPNQISFVPSQYKNIRPAPYRFIDPIEAARRYNAFNLQMEAQAFALGQERAGLLETEDLAFSQYYAQQQSNLQQQLISSENAFNQAQRLQAVEFGLPGAQATLEGKRQRGEQLASGKLLTSAEDRAYELAARSSAAEGNVLRGFGDDSVFGRRTSDLLSAQQRLGISQQGESLLNDWIQQGSNLLVDVPLKSTISQQLRGTPPILPSQYTTQQQSQLTSLTTVPLQFGIDTERQQRQFRTSQRQGNRQFNASNRLQNAQFNASGMFQASVTRFNAEAQNYDRIFNAEVAARQELMAEDLAAANAQSQQEIISAGLNTQGNIGTGQIVGAGGALLAGAGGLIDAIDNAFGGGGGGQAQGTGGANILGGGSGTTQMDVNDALSSGGYDPGQFQTVDTGAGSTGVVIPQNSSGGYDIPTGFVGVSSQENGSIVAVPSTEFQNARNASQGITTRSLSDGATRVGNFVDNLGIVSNNPQLSNFGKILTVAGNVGQMSEVINGTPGLTKEQRADQLKSALVSQATTPEQKANIESQFDEVKKSLGGATGTINTGLEAFTLVNNYDQLSDASKFRIATSLFLKGSDVSKAMGLTKTGSADIKGIQIPGTDGKLSLGGALSMANAGINVYTLVNNWGELSGIDKAVLGTNSALSIANTAQQFNLLGGSTPETAAITAKQLLQAGAVETASEGMGAVTVSAANAGNLPAGYTVTKTLENGSVVAMPQNTLATSLQNIGGAAAIATGAYTIYKNWGSGGAGGRTNGAMGGFSIASGLLMLGAVNPAFYAAALIGGTAAGALLGSIKTGKEEHQLIRDKYRDNLEELGMAEKINGSHNLTLADGSRYDIGRDGDSGEKDWYNTNNRRADQEDVDKLHAYDVDYTKDLDAIVQLQGKALSSLMFGSNKDQASQMGGYFTNAAVSQAKGADLTEENYMKATANMKSFFDQAGITDKKSAYALANQMFGEGRVDQTGLVTIQQGINLVFDDFGTSFKGANKLMDGVNLGRNEGKPGKPSDKPSSTVDSGRLPQQPVNAPLNVTPSQVGIDPGRYSSDVGMGTLPADVSGTSSEMIGAGLSSISGVPATNLGRSPEASGIGRVVDVGRLRAPEVPAYNRFNLPQTI